MANSLKSCPFDYHGTKLSINFLIILCDSLFYRNFILFKQTPVGSVCPGRKRTKPVPQLAGQYSYREEIVSSGATQVSQADVSLGIHIIPNRYTLQPFSNIQCIFYCVKF